LEKPISKWSYIIGLIVIVASIYSQYVIEDLGFLTEFFLVYGIPVITVSLLRGRSIIRRAFNRTFTALKFGLGMFGAFTDLAIILTVIFLFILLSIDPAAVDLLNKPNPVLQIPPESAWIMVYMSLFIVGPIEEYVFRGFVFGGMVAIFKNRHWLVLAFASSVIFASVHLYYGLVYGIASIVAFTALITMGMAMAATYYLSGGNLLIPALIHGAYDATGFLSIAVSVDVGLFLREAMIGIGTIIAVGLFIQTIFKRREAQRQERKAAAQRILQEQRIKFCIYCGQRMPLDAVFCPNCGKKQELNALVYS
jgi:membrane protease YdiL (CAAX protease family)